MASRYLTCLQKKLIHPPKWAYESNCLVYEVVHGSMAYGCSKGSSDEDIYGVLVPPRRFIWCSDAGIIPGFGHNPYLFDQFQQHGAEDKECGKQYDFSIYNIVRFFQLCYGNNPNMVDALFVPQNCVTHITKIGHLIRDNRHLFLSKLCVATFRGYAISQLKKMENKQPEGKRLDTVQKFGFDVKFAYHLVRLLFQCEQVLLEKDLDLQRNSQTYIAIREGRWTKEKVIDVFNEKDKELEGLVLKSDLQAKPDEPKLRDLLLECLEIHYGKISDRVIIEDGATSALKSIAEIANKALREEK